VPGAAVNPDWHNDMTFGAAETIHLRAVFAGFLHKQATPINS
jgi:hypothetical protein